MWDNTSSVNTIMYGNVQAFSEQVNGADGRANGAIVQRRTDIAGCTTRAIL